MQKHYLGEKFMVGKKKFMAVKWNGDCSSCAFSTPKLCRIHECIDVGPNGTNLIFREIKKKNFLSKIRNVFIKH